jgi:hypothetical protein
MAISEIERVTTRFGNDLSNFFYYVAQSFIGQDDGGIASHFDSEIEFENNLGREILITLAAVVGNEEFERLAPSIWERRPEAKIEAVMSDPAELTEASIEELSPKIADRIIAGIQASFPTVPAEVLHRFALPLVAELDAYLKVEMRFAASATPTI